MTNKKITELTPTSTLTGGELAPIVQGGVTKQTTVTTLTAHTVTTVKTGPYTANGGEFIPVDATNAGVTVTFPTAPANGTRLTVKKIDTSTNAVTLQLGGTDVFNTTGGSQTGTLALKNQAIALQYSSSGAIWYVIGDDLPLSQLDARYTTPAAVAATYETQTHAASTYVDQITATKRAAVNADHASAFGRIQKAFLGTPSGTFLARSGNDYTFLLGVGSGRYAAWFLPRLAQSLNSVIYTVNCLTGAAIQVPMLSQDDTAGTYAGAGTWTNQPTTNPTDVGYRSVPLTVNTSAGSTTVTVTAGTVTTADIGRRVVIVGADVGGADKVTTIGAVSGSTFSIGSTAATAVTAASATIYPTYRFNTTADATATWVSPASTTSVAIGYLKAQNGGLGKVTISGASAGTVVAALLPTAQQVVTSGRYPNTILIANGGTLNPTDRVIDYYSGAAVTYPDQRQALAEGLSPDTYTVVVTGTGYTPTGGTGSRIYVDRWAYGSASITPTTASAAMFTAYDASCGFTSAWEYAIECRPATGSTYTFIGQNAHQYEDQQTFTIKINDASASPADGTITACTSAEITRTTKLYHPETGAALASSPIATGQIVYRLDRNGLSVTPTITWNVDTYIDTAYMMMPLAAAAASGVKMDRVAFEADANVYTMVTPGSSTRSGYTRSAFGWMWDSSGKVGAALYVPDHYGFTNGYASSVGGSQVEDRASSNPATKFYFPWVGPNVPVLYKAGSVVTYTGRYMLNYFPNGADAALAAA